MFVLRYNSRVLPAGYIDFFVAVLTASASFIGLLFVARTLITDKNGKSKKQITAGNILFGSALGRAWGLTDISNHD